MATSVVALAVMALFAPGCGGDPLESSPPITKDKKGKGRDTANDDDVVAGGTGSQNDDVEQAPAAVYNDVTKKEHWSSFDPAGLASGVGSFAGAAFDGKYIYFVPWGNGGGGVVARYDTTAPFGDESSWSTFDARTVHPGAKGFVGAVFDGTHVYFVPHYSNGYDYSPITLRFDTKGTFSSGGSWKAFDVSTVRAGARGFRGGAFDGKYVYFVPRNNGEFHGIATRFDITKPFDSTSSWSTYDITSVSSSARGFVGGAFDKRYVYFTPFTNKPATVDGFIARYDSEGAFGGASSWKVFDVSTLNPSARGFYGSMFDGNHVYFIPSGSSVPSGFVARYSAKDALDAPTSWTFMDLAKLNPEAAGFRGGTFDGRYMYFAPSSKRTLARVDTTADFGDAKSWSFIDLTTVTPSVPEALGAAFDGRAIYIVPHTGTRILRFEARTTTQKLAFDASFL